MAQAPVEELDVTVVSLDGLGRPYAAPPTPYDPPRMPSALLDDPIHVAVQLPGPSTALVHLRARTPDGRTLVATRCYGVRNIVRDSVVLTDLGSLDRDGDSFLDDPSIACREPTPGNIEGRPCTSTDLHLCEGDVAADCEDDPDENGAGIYPGNENFICQNGVDEDCDGDIDEACIDADGDGVDRCPEGETVACDCNDDDATINPRAEDVCLDGIDQDCSGADACCDADGDGFTQCIDPDTLERTGDCVDVPEDCTRQEPECNPDTVDPAAINPGATEICFDEIDNNCNRRQNEIGECLGPDFDGDGVSVCGMEVPGQPCEEPAWDCDPGINPLARDRCGNGIDEDLDGTVDEMCPAGDMDGDGQVPPFDCDDGDPLAFTHDDGRPLIERCNDGVPQSCVPGEDADCSGGTDPDMDGFVEPMGCDMNPDINPDRNEECNGIDDNCDLITDEVLDPMNLTGCADGMRLDFTNDIQHCGMCRFNCADEFGMAADVCADGTCDCSTQMDSVGPCMFGDDPRCCDDGCQDVANDPMNCGGCGVQCGAGELCIEGRCGCGGTVASGLGEQACPEPMGAVGLEANQCCQSDPMDPMSGSCRDVTSDVGNCGVCGRSCGANAVCDDRICTCDPASPNLDDCNGDLGMPGGDGCETDLQTSRPHCGMCGNRCNPPQATGRCVGGSCTIDGCNADFDDCDGLVGNGCEGNLRSLAHCNGCGNVCNLDGADETCAMRVCEIDACDSDVADCNSNPSDGCETPLGTVSDCARCGDVCNLPNATPVCNSGRRCRIGSCDDGWEDCNGDPSDGCETNIDADENCGTCGNDCGSFATCMGRACACNARRLDCATGSPWCEVPFGTNNCGACGARCGANESCDGMGRCACGGTTSAVGGGTACPGERCCGGSCRPLGTLTNCSDCGDSCRMNEMCIGSGPWACRCDGGPRCTGGNTCCPGDGGCVNLNDDENNCGGCGITCGPGETCNGGTCQCNGGAECTGAQVCCGAAGCVNPNNDEGHCGGCDVMCGGDETCTSRVCSCGDDDGAAGMGAACAAGETCCEGTGDCVDTDDDRNNCGGCGISCGPMEDCVGGRCVCNSDMGSVGGGEVCTGAMGTCCPAEGCVNVMNDDDYCGNCTTSCTAPDTCTMGMCGCEGGAACTGGDMCCPGDGCTDTTSDIDNCGMCGRSCSSGGDPFCCDSGCVDRDTDAMNCGSCGMTCMGAADTCCGGGCVNTDTSLAHCNGCGNMCTGSEECCGTDGCVDTSASDVNNCGGCGTTCVMGETCNVDTCECAGEGGAACGSGEVCCAGGCQAPPCM